MSVNKIKLGIFKPCLYGDGGGSPLKPMLTELCANQNPAANHSKQ